MKLARRAVSAAAAVVVASWMAGPTAAVAQTPAMPAARASGPQAPRADAATQDYRLQARALAPGVWVVEGDNDDFSVANGCNIINTGFIATGAGVLVINTGPSRRYGEQLRRLIARTTPEPVVQVLHLNLHPDYFLGNQAFADVPRVATARTRAGIASESSGYEANLYRLCGDWMKGTQTLPPDRTLELPPGGAWRLGSREFVLQESRGHTGSDLVLRDVASGVVFAGGLVFAERVPTTPHADVPAWLDALAALRLPADSWVVPSHGPVHRGASGLEQTRRYLQWLDSAFAGHAARGLDMNEVLRAPVPGEFRALAAFSTEFVRNVAHLYPRYERAAFGPGQPTRGPRGAP